MITDEEARQKTYGLRQDLNHDFHGHRPLAMNELGIINNPNIIQSSFVTFYKSVRLFREGCLRNMYPNIALFYIVLQSYCNCCNVDISSGYDLTLRIPVSSKVLGDFEETFMLLEQGFGHIDEKHLTIIVEQACPEMHCEWDLATIPTDVILKITDQLLRNVLANLDFDGYDSIIYKEKVDNTENDW